MVKRRWLYILIAFGIALLLAWQIRTASDVPPELAERAGLYDVEILRDKWGVPHIIGETDADASFGLAFAHAEDDFATIQGALLAARGRLATVFGPDGAPNDYMVALLRVSDVVRTEWPLLDSATQALTNGYADGLNVFAALHRDEAMPGLFPVTGADIVGGFVHKTPLFFGMDRVLSELFAEDTPDTPDNTLDNTATEERESAAATGSNGLAIAPSRSADGSTLLAVNSHQPWSGPVAWYEAHLMSREGLNMVGGTFPGAPMILHGHNKDLGWAHTVNSPDVLDLYTLELKPDDENSYRFGDEWLPFERDEVTIDVQVIGLISWTFEREVLWSVHGPVVRTDSGAVAVRFSGWGNARQISQWYAMNRATDFESWSDAVRMQAVPVFNTVYADRWGRIHYLYNAHIPERTHDANWSGRLDGTDPDLLWETYLPLDSLPQVTNPPVGFIQNANSTPFGTTGTEADPRPTFVGRHAGIERHMTNRALRAVRLFTADSSITWDEFRSYKYDVTYDRDSRMASMLRQIALARPPVDSLTRSAIDVLERWDLVANDGNRQAALPIMALRPLLDDYGSVPTTDELFERVLAAAEHLMAHFGTLEPEWADVNRLRHGETDLGIAGGPDLLHAVYALPDQDGRLVGYQGDSYVLLVEWKRDGTIRSESIHQFGTATSHPDNAHYSDQSDLFVRRELKEVAFSELDVRAAAVRTYRPGRK